MKLSVLLLAVSLVLNVLGVAAFALRPALLPGGVRDLLARTFSREETTTAAKPLPPPVKTAPRPKLWSELDAQGDFAALIARLRAAGFPATVIRAMIEAQLSARFDTRLRALQESDPDTPFWKLKPAFYSMDDKRLIEMQQISRERAKLFRTLFSDPFFATDDVSAMQRRQFGNLTRAKIDQVQRIEDDYNEMMEQVRASMGGIQLPEDREKLALLTREKRADLATILTQEELDDYEIRSSRTTSTLRSRLGGFEPTEAEFRALYRAQTALNEKFAGTSSSGVALNQDLRQAAQQAFNDQVRAAFGDTRYADYVRETDRDYQALARLTQRENLPADTVLRAFNLRDDVARESNRIFDDATLGPEQKRSALQTLAQNTRLQITTTLGPTVGASYVRVVDQWLSAVERGAAVKFDNLNSLLIVTDQGSMSFSGGPSYRWIPPSRSGP